MALIPKVPAPLEVVVGLASIAAGIGAGVAWGPDDAKNLVDALKTAGSTTEYVAAFRNALPFIVPAFLVYVGINQVKDGIRQMRGHTGYQNIWRG